MLIYTTFTNICCSLVFGVMWRNLRLLVIHFVVVSRHQQSSPLTSDSPWSVALVCRRDVHSTRRSQIILAQNRDFGLSKLHSQGVSCQNIAMTSGMEKLEWLGYPMVKIFEDMFIRFDRIHKRDRHTDGQTPHDGIGSACI